MAQYISEYTGEQIDAGIRAAIDALPKSGGTMTGELILSGAPESDDGAATKKYVDDVANTESERAKTEAIEAVAVRDQEVSDTHPWSSSKILDTLCPPFEVSENPVVCYPVEHSPLAVEARVEPVQHFDWVKREGETTQNGTPTPEAPVPLVDSIPAGGYYVPSTAPEGGYWRVDLDASLGGIGDYRDALEIDAYTGRFRIVRKSRRQSMAMLLWTAQGVFGGGRYFTAPLAIANKGHALERDIGKCTHFVYTITGAQNTAPQNSYWVNSAGNGVRIMTPDADTVEELANIIADAVMVYALATPIITTGQATHVTSTTGLTALNAVSMGLTAPDPEHPVEITVAESVTVHRCGKNLLDYDAMCDYTKWDEDIVSAGNAPTNTVNRAYVINLTPGAYVFSADTTSFPMYLYLCRHKNGISERIAYITTESWSHNPLSFAVEDGYVYYFRMGSTENITSFGKQMSKLVNPQIEPGNTATPYEPYHGDTYDVALPEGFAGGEVDVTGGEATEEWAKIVLDGTESWEVNGKHLANGSDYYYQITTHLDNVADTNHVVVVCSHYPSNYVANSQTLNGADIVWCRLRIRFGEEMPIADWKDYLAAEHAAGHPVTIYYKLATQTTQTIDPTSINALPGCNTIMTDADALTVEGHADPVHIITEQSQLISGLTQRIAAIESAVTN